jgi:glutamyl-tRNA reductase
MLLQHFGDQELTFQLVMIGAHQRDVSVAVRERLAFGPDRIVGALADLHTIASEAFILSTCNRVEIYALLPASRPADAVLLQFLAEQSGIAPDVIAPSIVFRAGGEVARHICRVAAGLDSMVLGEDQIVGQIKGALEQAQRSSTLGQVLHRLVHTALAAGKAVRTHTGIARSRMSVVSVALDLAEQMLGSLATRSVLIVGAGQMAELALKHLRDTPALDVAIANRSITRAEGLAGRYGASGRPLADLPALLAASDVVVSCTAAQEYVIQTDDVRCAMTGRDRPLLLLDLAVPRDIAPAAGQVAGVRLYAVDDLQAICAANRAARASEIDRAEALIGAAVQRFESWRRARQATPTIRALRDRAEAIRASEVERMLARLPGLGDSDREAIHALSAAIVNKLLHQPIVALKEQPGDDLIGAAQRLFQLEA